MALASLRFQRNAQDYEESRQGMTVFAGDAASFHEWQFRLQIKKSLCKAEELPALTAKVVDALRGEALSCSAGTARSNIAVEFCWVWGGGGKWSKHEWLNDHFGSSVCL